VDGLQVWINGELKCRAADPAADYVAVGVSLLPEEHAAVVDVSGSRPTTGTYHDYIAWESYRCSVGDEIVLRIADLAEADSPAIANHEVGANETADVRGPICLFCGVSYLDASSMFRGKRGYCCAECARGFVESLHASDAATRV
jgi:hypothetical protein